MAWFQYLFPDIKKCCRNPWQLLFRWPVSRRRISDNYEIRSIRATFRKGLLDWINRQNKEKEDSQQIFLRLLCGKVDSCPLGDAVEDITSGGSWMF